MHGAHVGLLIGSHGNKIPLNGCSRRKPSLALRRIKSFERERSLFERSLIVACLTSVGKWFRGRRTERNMGRHSRGHLGGRCWLSCCAGATAPCWLRAGPLQWRVGRPEASTGAKWAGTKEDDPRRWRGPSSFRCGGSGRWLPAAVDHLRDSQGIFFLEFCRQEVLGEALVSDWTQEPVDGRCADGGRRGCS